MRFSLALVPAFAAAVYAQGTALPAATTSTTALPVGNCNSCFFLADVAQVIFANFTQTATASAIVSATSGRNGTVVTSTFFQAPQPFSFGTAGLLSGTTVGASYIPIQGSTLTISGVTLTSPTAYNVFTGYTSFTQVASNGQCVTSTGTSSIFSSAYSFIIQPGAPASEIIQAEDMFIATIGGAVCPIIGGATTTTVPIQTVMTTVTSSATSLFRPSLLPDSSSSSKVPASTTSALTGSTNATSSRTTSRTTSIVMLTPTPTIVLGAGSVSHPRTFSASLVAAILVIPGIAAWLL